MGKMLPTRKSSFLLLEVLISLFLIVTCLFPLLLPNIKLYRLEQRRLDSSLAYSLDRNLLCQVKCALLERKYSWEDLKKGKSECGCWIVAIDKTERAILNKEGLLLEITTPYKKHTVFVERGN